MDFMKIRFHRKLRRLEDEEKLKKILKEDFDTTTNPLKTRRLWILTNLRSFKVFIKPS